MPGIPGDRGRPGNKGKIITLETKLLYFTFAKGGRN